MEIKFPIDRITSILSPTKFNELDTNGFVYFDNVFGEEWSTSFLEEIQLLHEQQLLYSNKTYYEGKKEKGKFIYSYAVSKPNIFELDILDENVRTLIPALNELYTNKSIMNHLNTIFPELSLNEIEVKVQYNAGNNGCFPMHIDTSPSVSHRQLTALLYLNPNWKKEDGGELRFYPFPYSHLDIEPVFDRLVFFCSHQMLHRVLPSKAPRYCLTIWFSGTNPIPFPRQMDLKEYDQVLSFLVTPKNKVPLSKLIFAKEWAESVKSRNSFWFQ